MESENEFERNRADEWEQRYHAVDQAFDYYKEFVLEILTEEQIELLAQYVNGQHHALEQEVPQEPNSAPYAEVLDSVSPQYEQLGEIVEDIAYIGTYIKNNTSNEHIAFMDDTLGCSSAHGHPSCKASDEDEK
ncbi:hypothetical protein DdX_10618 [Ditylenchus destructor]|uniref:Uncharacterized protein n=1 Tax=Ditylenchus destructor TaxID=166010 RepID=A0AAD4N2E0_9BILA|nr:hypothetical protein DdX_10618 [Ditylenchus destructor]